MGEGGGGGRAGGAPLGEKNHRTREFRVGKKATNVPIWIKAKKGRQHFSKQEATKKKLGETPFLFPFRPTKAVGGSSPSRGGGVSGGRVGPKRWCEKW